MTRYVRPLIFILLFSFGTGIFHGCFSAPEKKSYYQIYYMPKEDHRAPYPLVGRVKTFDIDKIYKRYNLIYRSSPYELSYYNSQFWAIRPEQMMTDIMTNHVMKTHLFEEVITQLDKEPAYVITGFISAFDEIDAKDKWFARVSMTFLFIDYKTGNVLISHSFDRRKEVTNHQVVYIVRAYSEIVEEEIDLFMQEVSQKLSEMESNEASSQPSPAAE